jgi:hypothetical protein
MHVDSHDIRSPFDAEIIYKSSAAEIRTKYDSLPPSPCPFPDTEIIDSIDSIFSIRPIDIKKKITQKKVTKLKEKNTKKCSIHLCDHLVRTMGYCKKHYNENKNKKCNLCNNKRSKKKLCKSHFLSTYKCVIDNCCKEIFNIKNMLCRKHYSILKERLKDDE